MNDRNKRNTPTALEHSGGWGYHKDAGDRALWATGVADMTELQSKLQKLKTLAERGSPGERDNAKALFDKLCEKYGVSIEDVIDSEQIETRWFKYTGGDLFRQLLLQCIYKTMGGKWDRATYKKVFPKTRCVIGVKCTIAQGIEIELDYAFYTYHLKTDLQRVVDMFIQRNNIFAPDGPVDDNPTALSEADIQLALSLKKHTRTLQIRGE